MASFAATIRGVRLDRGLASLRKECCRRQRENGIITVMVMVKNNQCNRSKANLTTVTGGKVFLTFSQKAEEPQVTEH